MCGTCNTHGNDEKCVQCLFYGNKEIGYEDVDWTRLDWLRIWSHGQCHVNTGNSLNGWVTVHFWIRVPFHVVNYLMKFTPYGKVFQISLIMMKYLQFESFLRNLTKLNLIVMENGNHISPMGVLMKFALHVLCRTQYKNFIVIRFLK